MLYNLHSWTHGPLFIYCIAKKFGRNNVWQKWMNQDFGKQVDILIFKNQALQILYLKGLNIMHIKLHKL